jgi:hypothetical protein
MKRYLLFYAFFILNAVYIQAQYSVHQRIIFGNFAADVAANSLSEAIPSFCFDAGRQSPSNLAAYKQVHLGDVSVSFGNGPAIPLQTALNNGSVSLEGSGYHAFRISNNRDIPMHIISNGGIVGDEPGDVSNAIQYFIDKINSGNVSDQEELWLIRRKIAIYKNEGLLTTSHPTSAQLAQAESRFRKDHHLLDKYALEEVIRQKAGKLDEVEEIDALKLIVYRYYNLIPERPVTNAELAAADASYRKLKIIPSTNKLTENLYSDESYINGQKYFFEYEGVLSVSNANPHQTRLAFDSYCRQMGKSPEEVNKLLPDKIKEYQEKAYAARDFLYRLGIDMKNSREIESAFHINTRSQFNNKEFIDQFSFYKQHFLSFLTKKKGKPAQEIANAIVNIKSALGLPASTAIDQATIQYFKDFDKKLAAENIIPGEAIQDMVPNNGEIYLVTYDYTDGYKIFKTNVSNAETKIHTVAKVGYSYSSSYVEKISSDLYFFEGKLAPVSDLNSTIQQSEYFKYQNTVTFGENFTPENIQSFVRNYEIKNIASNSENTLSFLKVTNEQYVIPIDPEIKITKISDVSVISFSLDRKLNPPAGSGIIGKLRFRVIRVANLIVDKASNGIRSVFRTCANNREMDFAANLRTELKELGIKQDQLLLDVEGIDITKNIFLNYDKSKQIFIAGYDISNTNITVPFRTLFSTYPWEVPGIISYGRKKRLYKGNV